MPENRYVLTENQRKAFNKWFAEKYGFWKALITADQALQPYILEWLQVGQPWLKEFEARVTGFESPLPRGILPPSMVTKTGTELAAEAGAGPYYTDKYPTEPYPLGEGFKWVRIAFDPNTGRPIKEQWISQKVTVPEKGIVDLPEDAKWYVPGEVYYSPSTKKYYGATGGEISVADAMAIKNAWSRQVTPPIPPEQIGGGWRPGELEFQREQFEWQKKQAQQDIAASYEDWRRRLLGELTAPEDWITRWMVEQTPEKYPWQPSQIEISDIQKSISQVEAAIAKRISDIKFSPQEFPEILPQLENLVSMEKELASWKEAEASFVETQQPTIESIVRGVKGTPPAPGWLSQFAPGQVAGKPITKEQIATPSGQQLTRLPPSQAGGLSGFAEWVGGRPWRDILAHAEIMQPFTPSGAGNRQWRPVSQGVV